jgi:hypothetical protein
MIQCILPTLRGQIRKRETQIVIWEDEFLCGNIAKSLSLNNDKKERLSVGVLSTRRYSPCLY